MIGEWLKALLYGIVEGVTEWLPVSSTGHLILFEELIPFGFSSDARLLAEFGELFEVVIQLGAILAVVILMRERLFPRLDSHTRAERRAVFALWGRLLIASLPAALLGVLGDFALERLTGKDLDGWIYHAPVVAAALIIYGVAFLLIERRADLPTRVSSVEALSCRDAVGIGFFQALSLVPGTSRSGATVLGGRLLGFSRPLAAEFSFLMAIPVMLGASAVKMLGFCAYLKETGSVLPIDAWGALVIGCLTAFAVSLIAVRFLMEFVKRHSFAPFGVYRILLGAVVLMRWILTGWK